MPISFETQLSRASEVALYADPPLLRRPQGPKCVQAEMACLTGSRTAVSRNAFAANACRGPDDSASPFLRGDSVCSWPHPTRPLERVKNLPNSSRTHLSLPPLRQSRGTCDGIVGAKKSTPCLLPILRTTPPSVVPATFLPLTNSTSQGKARAKPASQGRASFSWAAAMAPTAARMMHGRIDAMAGRCRDGQPPRPGRCDLRARVKNLADSSVLLNALARDAYGQATVN